MKHVFISIIDFNGEENTIACLDSLEKSTKDNFSLDVVVVDNASREKFIVIKERFKNFSLHIIRSETNTGFSGGHNIGIKYALENGAEYVVILNNDTIVEKNAVKELVNTFENDEAIGIVSPKIYFAKGYEFHKDRYAREELGKVLWYTGGKMDWKNLIGYHRGVNEVDTGQYDTGEQTELPTGGCMAIKKEVFEKINMLDEQYFLYYEDTDFAVRAKKNGFSICYAPKAIVWHKNAGSAGGSGSSLQDYYISRNRLYFGFKYAPLRTKMAMLKESLSILHNGRSWQKKGVGDFFLRKFGKGSYK